MVTNKQIQSENLKENIEALKVEVSLLRDAYFQLEEAKKQLKKNEEQYRLLTESNRDLIWTTDIKGKITFVNSVLTKLLGYKRVEVLGESCFKLMTKESVKIANALRKIMNDSKKKGASFELEYVHKNGTAIPFDVSITIIRDENGNPLVIQGASRNILEKKKAEEKIYMLSSAVEQSNEGVAIADLTGKLIFVNQAWSKMHGYKSSKEIIGKNLAIFHNKKQIESVVKPFNEKAMKLGTYSGEVGHVTKDGKIFPTLMTSTLLKDEQGKSYSIVGIAKDITEQKTAEEKLKQSEKRFRDVALSSADWIWEVDAQGKYTFVSEGSKRILGYKSKEVIGKSPFDFMSKAEAQRVGKIFQSIVAKKSPIVDLENWNVTKSGKKVLLLTNGVPVLDEKGILKGYRGVDKDITEQKEAEEEIIKLNKVLTTIKEVTQNIFQINDKEKFLKNVCESISKYAYKMVWIGMCDEETKDVVPVAEAGFEKGYLKTIKVRYDTSVYGKGPTGTAIRTGKPSVMNNIVSDPRYRPWKKEALKRGYNSSIAIPIYNTHKVLGALNIYSDKNNVFDKSEIALLEELSHDISIALRSLESTEKLKESEEKYRLLYETSSDAIMTLEPPSWKFTSGNPAIVKMFGVKNEKEFIALRPWEVSPKYQPDGQLSSVKAKKMIGIAMEKGKNFFEWTHKNINGKNFSATVLLNRVDLDSYTFIQARVSDITIKKRVEEALKESEEKYRNLIERANDGVIIIQDKKIKFVNSRLSKMIGIPVANVIDKLFLNYVHPSEIKEVIKNYYKRMRGYKVPAIYESALIKKNGDKFPVELNAGVITYRGRKADLVIVRDITERKKNEYELKQKIDEIRNEKDKINTIVEGIGDGVFVVGKDLKITLFNPIASQISGFSEKEVLGKKYSDILKFVFESDINEINDKFVKNTIRTGKIQGMSNHTLLVHKSGDLIPVADSASPLEDEKGKIVGCVVVFRDATRERNIDKIKTEFVSIASHQLRTPLSGIKWFTELLLKQKVGKLNDEQKDYVNQVHTSNERLIRLVSDLLDVSHIETGRKFFMEMKKTNLSEIVKQVLEGSIGMIKDKKLKIDVCKELASKVYLTVDPDKIRQVFYNIITNAIKYSKNSGKIDLCLKSNKKDIVFFVKDRGLGIPRKDQSRVFEKFFRADNVMTTQTDGTGLGLYITKAIVEAYDGKVWFESKVGKGTTFFFSLPKKVKNIKK